MSVSGDSLQGSRRRDEPPRGLEETTGTLTTTGREAERTSVAEAGVEEDSPERVAIRDSRGPAPVTSISLAAEATMTEAGVRMTGTLEGQDTSLEVAGGEVVVVTTTTGEMTTGGEEAEEEITGMSRGAVMVMVTTPMEDMGILLMDMATLLMDTATLLMVTVTPLTVMATLGQAGSPTLDSEAVRVAAALITLGPA